MVKNSRIQLTMGDRCVSKAYLDVGGTDQSGMGGIRPESKKEWRKPR